jgi:hypothetical protein
MKTTKAPTSLSDLTFMMKRHQERAESQKYAGIKRDNHIFYLRTQNGFSA